MEISCRVYKPRRARELTIPRLLRPLFRLRRELLGELARAGAEAVKELVCHASGEGDARPGIVVSVATAGDLLQWHPHLHLITTDGGRGKDGSWYTLTEWDGPVPLAHEPRSGPQLRGHGPGMRLVSPGASARQRRSTRP